MKRLTIESDSEEKIQLLTRVAQEMGMKTISDYELTDEDMALPGTQVSEPQLEAWLAKGDGDEEYTSEQMRALIAAETKKVKRK